MPDGTVMHICNSAEDKELAEAMNTYWVEFAKSGICSGRGLPQWESTESGGYMDLYGGTFGMKYDS